MIEEKKKRAPGGGRKRISESGAAVRIYLTFPPEIADYLKLQTNASAYLTKLVAEDILRETRLRT